MQVSCQALVAVGGDNVPHPLALEVGLGYRLAVLQVIAGNVLAQSIRKHFIHVDCDPFSRLVRQLENLSCKLNSSEMRSLTRLQMPSLWKLLLRLPLPRPTRSRLQPLWMPPLLQQPLLSGSASSALPHPWELEPALSSDRSTSDARNSRRSAALPPRGPCSTLSLIHISEPTRRTPISYAVFCLKKKKQK